MRLQPASVTQALQALRRAPLPRRMERFSVNAEANAPRSLDKIICLGKNYLEHAKELGDAVPEKPVVFLKPPSAIVYAHRGATTTTALPQNAGEVHYETEIILEVADPEAMTFSAATLGLDLTLRTLQRQLKADGHPWERAKVFKGSAIVGPLMPLEGFSLEECLNTDFKFLLDGKVCQEGRGSDMLMKPAEALAYVSQFFPVCPGDLLFTGTPKGVGPLKPGQTAELIWGDKLGYQLSIQ